MKWSTGFKGAWAGLKFVYQHPQILEIAAAVAPGAPGQVAAGIATVVKAVGASQAAKAAATPSAEVHPSLPEPLPAPPPAPPPPPTAQPDGPPPFPGLVVVPEVDLVAKWRGTLDRMAMDILGKRMDEDELYNNAKLLERGDVEGVTRNLEGKKPR